MGRATARRLGASVPSSNRGLKGVGGAAAIIDYLTLTAPVSAVPPVAGRSWVEACFHAFLGGSALRLNGAMRGMRNFYESHWVIVSPDETVVGFIATGGNNGTFCLQLMGQGCAHVSDWKHVARTIDQTGARITRVDCAHDDFAGAHPVAEALALYHAGQFARGGRPPAAEHIDDLGNNSGQTLYVGRNSGNQTLCVYEKGKQLGDRASPWVRYEGRFGNKYRAIPADVLVRPGVYLAGMFPCLAWISEVTDKFATAAKKVACGMRSLAFHLRRQYGRVLNAAKTVFPDESEYMAWVGSLCRSGLPDKLKIPHADIAMRAGNWRYELCHASL